MPDKFTVEPDYLFIGRTFAEYRRMFGLDLADLRGRSVLDCPGGPSSFTAIASQLEATALAVDPKYGPSVSALEATCSAAVEQDIAQLREQRDLFVWNEYGDVDTRGRYLRAAYERFLADYAQHPGRYVPAALPALPFQSNAFSLVLSGNFLFLYDDRLDLPFHRTAVRELARVARDELRVFTLASLDRQRSDFVTSVVETLRADGLEVEFREVPYEFQPDATEMLVVSNVTSYRSFSRGGEKAGSKNRYRTGRANR